MIIGIVAIDRNNAIGKDGKLPWHYSADLKHFKKTTTGNAVVMGGNTRSSIGKPLPNRLNVVLTRSAKIDDQTGIVTLNNKDAVLALNKYLSCDLFIIGGAKTYESFRDVIEKWIVTHVPVEVETPDVSMPRDFLEGFEPAGQTDLGDGLKVEIFCRRPR